MSEIHKSETATRVVRAKLWAARGAAYFGMASPREFTAASTLCALMIVFRIVNLLTWKFDSDESQHLHVVWGWARGFVQYRDLCDNHMPLFHMLFAPIYALLGDRPTILLWMRAIMLPLSFLQAWATYQAGTLLFSRRVGVWSMLLIGFYPGWHWLSVEFRTDNLWAPVWLLCIVVLVKGPLSIRRSLVAGLLMGCCFGISMKTSLLILSVLVGAAVTFLVLGKRRPALSRGQLWSCATSFVVCALAVPSLIMAGFAYAGVWRQFRYWVFENNILPGLENHAGWWTVLFPVLFPLLVAAVALALRRVPDPTLAFRRGFLSLTCGFYMLVLWSYWRLVTRQDYLPFHPLAYVFYAPVILALGDRLLAQRSKLRPFLSRWPLPATIVATEFLVAFFARPFWQNNAQIQTDFLRATYRLTDPGDFVLDLKGETVFRQRAFAPIWEPFVMERIRRGWMVDDAAQRCVQTHACVATKDKDMSADAARFVDEHYIPIGSGLYVAGAFLTPQPQRPKLFEFDVVIPAPYEIVAPRDAPTVTGFLDQAPYSGARLLQPGRHTFEATGATGKLALLWAQAADRNFSPFQ